jgi:hypothetical protein
LSEWGNQSREVTEAFEIKVALVCGVPKIINAIFWHFIERINVVKYSQIIYWTQRKQL